MVKCLIQSANHPIQLAQLDKHEKGKVEENGKMAGKKDGRGGISKKKGKK